LLKPTLLLLGKNFNGQRHSNTPQTVQLNQLLSDLLRCCLFSSKQINNYASMLHTVFYQDGLLIPKGGEKKYLEMEKPAVLSYQFALFDSLSKFSKEEKGKNEFYIL
jgi:hypothetical protein